MGFLSQNNIKAVAFDIDGTFYSLSETNRRVLYASLLHLPFAVKYNRARQELRKEDAFKTLPLLSRSENAKRMCRLIYNKDDEETVELFLEKEKRIFTDRYYELFKNIKPYKGVENLLSLLKNRNYPMAVLSDFPVGSKLEAMGLSSYFPIQLSSEDMGRSKPCSTPFDVLGEKLGVEKENILYIGDSPFKDSLGAKRAGLRSALITKGKETGEADLVVSDWFELKEKLF